MDKKIKNKYIIIKPKIFRIPILTIEMVVFPHLLTPIFINDIYSIKTLQNKNIKQKKYVIFLIKKDLFNISFKKNNFFKIGTIAKIQHKVILPDGTLKILVKGIITGKILYINKNPKYEIHEAYVKIFKLKKISYTQRGSILIKILLNKLENYINLNPTTPLNKGFLTSNQSYKINYKFIYRISTYFPFNIEEQLKLISFNNFNLKLEYFLKLIEKEIQLIRLENKINNNLKNQFDISQKEYFLQEQIKSIQDELKNIGRYIDENELLKKDIISCGMPPKALKKAISEFQKLKSMPVMSAEATVIRSYLEWLVKLPWNKESPVKIDLNLAKDVLNKHHYGLSEVKERILEYLAEQSRNKNIRGPIICLVGAPGVGKTSLGQAIASAIGRKFVRMSLGGLHDEAEIRGHRRTYIGALPGRIIQKLSYIQVNNPVFLLDEIDKISSNQVRGDPEYALLEVLDPEQNRTFSDNYLEVDFDLSKIMFIATANSLNISHVLRDRMEIIKIDGYTENEKIFITKKYLINKYFNNHCLYNKEITFSKDVISNIIRFYTMESGLRELERNIAKIFRKALKIMLINKKIKSIDIDKNNLKDYLGLPKYDYKLKHTNKNQIGQVNGLAWTEYGGDTLLIETAFLQGKGALIYTGSLGKIMQESIKIALTVVRLNAKELKINYDFCNKYDIHVHVTEGATPKDGPSAGIAICTALVSSLTKNPIRTNIAMTGEITLYGKILPIGGLREKLLAASRTKHINKILIPKSNERDLQNIPEDIKSKLKILLVSRIEQVLEYSLVNSPY